MKTQICGHDVSWFVNSKSVKELGEFEESRIADLIKDGFNQGELNISCVGHNNRQYETTGWWHIVDWQDIALELYNAIKGCNPVTDDMTKAIKRFDKNWD